MATGEVEIKLDGKTETLRPSLGAAKRVNAAGGFTNVLNKLIAYDFDIFVVVVSAGLGKKPSEKDAVEESVYRTGLPKLVSDLCLYVGYLGNGGRPADDKVKDTGEE